MCVLCTVWLQLEGEGFRGNILCALYCMDSLNLHTMDGWVSYKGGRVELDY